MKEKKVVILQSNYLPWKGYFDLINMADVFVFYDDVQYTKNDWRNRNKIKTSKGVEWLTIPCGTKLDRLIYEVEINDNRWQKKHWRSLLVNYKKARYFSKYSDFFEEFYLKKEWTNLSELNQYLIRYISRNFFGINTEFDDSKRYKLNNMGSERLKQLINKLEATEYISGPSAKSYIDEKMFFEMGVKLTWMDYSGYPEYRQLFGEFIHEVSIVDLLFNEGSNAKKFMKSF